MNLARKIAIMKVFFLVAVLVCGQFAYAQTTSNRERYNSLRTSSVPNQFPDFGRYQGNSPSQSEINTLNSQPVVLNMKIPILLGVKVSDLYDSWHDPRSSGNLHEGIDILVPRGSFIVSPTDAVVTTVQNSGNGGNHVFTANPGGERYYYAHLDSFAAGLREGQVLKAGDLIGYVGNTGDAAGGATHLHFGIYQDNRAGTTNPFPRMTLEFSLQEKMDAVMKILSASSDPATLARTLVNQYKSTFVEAQTSGITLPPSIAQILSEKKTEALGIRRTLQIGSRGDDVKWLQGALGVTPADGVFGPKTRAAIISFQIKKGLTADGVFGPKSRAALGDSSLVDLALPAGCTASTAYSPLTGVKCR